MSMQVEEQGSSHSGSGSRHRMPSEPPPTMEIESPMDNWLTRLETFDPYPPPHAVNVIHLAKNGFYFAPDDLNPRKVACFGCGNTVNEFKEGDDPFRVNFHRHGCQFARERAPSGSSGSRGGQESVMRATPGLGEHSRGEITKPLQTTASTSRRAEISQAVPPPPDPYGAQSTVEQYVAAQHSRREFPARYAHSMPGNAPELSIVHVKAHDERTGRRAEVTRMQRTGARSERSISPSSMRSQFSYAGSGSLHDPAMSSIPLGQSIETRHSIVTQPQQDEYMDLRERLEHPDDFQDFLDSIDTRDASDRLKTFERAWPENHEFRNIHLLASEGFYCIGQGDAVECFSCHLIIANWTRNDHPRQRHRDMYSQCRFLRGESCGNIPLRSQRSQRGSATRGRSEPPRGRDRLDPHESFHESPYSSISRVTPIPSPQQSPLHRSISPYAGHRPQSPDPRGSQSLQPHASRSASHGYHPMSLSIPPRQPGVSPSRRSPSARGSSFSPGRASPPHSIISHPSMEQPSPSRQPFRPPEPSVASRDNLMQQFPCRNPYSESMRLERNRLQTFRNSDFRVANFHLRASDEALANAGLYYFGVPGSVRCWFCGGGLRDFEPNDDPWIEHAKFFPNCEFLLQQRGPAWINMISTANPNVQRPEMASRPQPQNLRQVVSSPHPLPRPPVLTEQQREARNREMLEEGMRSHPALTALQMGYTQEQIRNLQWRKILTNGCCFQTAEALLDALMGNPAPPSSRPPARQRSHHDSPPGSSRSSERNTVTITGGNFVGQNIINDRVYEGNVPHGQHTSSGGQRANQPVNRQQSNPGPSGSGQRNPGSSGRGNPSNLSNSPNLGGFDQGRFDQIMENAFSHPFFHGGMDDLFNINIPAQPAQPPAQHGNTPYSMTHSYRNPTGGTTTFSIRSSVPIGGQGLNNPIFEINPGEPQPAPPRPPPASYATVRPPTPPPLGAINIPRLGRPNPTSSTTTSTATRVKNVATTSAPAAAVSTSTSASSSAPSTSSAQGNEVSPAAAQERIAALERERLCKVCLSNEANILFKPCHHICACEGCARQLTVCPVCRARITTYIRTYHS